ncbi:D-glycero-beta-D-manno-heptose 1,7-bisphosphate 7-phosphatase [Crassaminicella thermophila]|uniref:D,D-heptose 1,7-bisphosphate phosphatase n=1 Tax=Crassaminicella thermophila TaxID=2599308 RepID=A0A5C0SE51_CRATE|nr:D-glycero-beta-D-manno-heptose 1,7-bisphosphate 7-phosphatase [Crassaminicella thermophila]QEK12885.1 D-glycero-beta-D-manno-heptose 1,7-bisphosphate 7-phosphatase [Crassaminicella thermophila]
MTKRAVFLDRDGTLIVDHGYIHKPSQVELLPGVIEALIKLKTFGFELIIISNQSGIGRGFFTKKEVDHVNQHLYNLLISHKIKLTGIYYCPHHPDDKCTCRKPEPGLLLQALSEHKIDAKKSYFVGDKLTDVQAAIAAGVQPVLLSRDNVSTHTIPIIIVDSLLKFTKVIKQEDF